MYNYMSRDVTASVGYDYILRQVNSAFANFILPVECDYFLGVYYFGVCLCASVVSVILTCVKDYQI